LTWNATIQTRCSRIAWADLWCMSSSISHFELIKEVNLSLIAKSFIRESQDPFHAQLSWESPSLSKCSFESSQICETQCSWEIEWIHRLRIIKACFGEESRRIFACSYEWPLSLNLKLQTSLLILYKLKKEAWLYINEMLKVFRDLLTALSRHCFRLCSQIITFLTLFALYRAHSAFPSSRLSASLNLLFLQRLLLKLIVIPLAFCCNFLRTEKYPHSFVWLACFLNKFWLLDLQTFIFRHQTLLFFVLVDYTLSLYRLLFH